MKVPYPPFPTKMGMSTPSNMWKFVSAVLKKDLTKEEAMGFKAEYVNDFIGKQLQLTIKQEPKKSDPSVKINKITDFLPGKADLPPLSDSDEVEAGDAELTEIEIPL